MNTEWNISVVQGCQRVYCWVIQVSCHIFCEMKCLSCVFVLVIEIVKYARNILETGIWFGFTIMCIIDPGHVAINQE